MVVKTALRLVVLKVVWMAGKSAALWAESLAGWLAVGMVGMLGGKRAVCSVADSVEQLVASSVARSVD